MKIVNGIIVFGTFALAIASAGSSYSITITEPSVVAGKALKPGEYKVQVEGDKATLKSGSQSIDAAVKVQNGDEKFSRTTVRYDTAGGKYRVDQIRVGGTKTTLIFGNDSGDKAGQPAEVR